MSRERYGEVERMRDELAAAHDLNEQLVNENATLKNMLAISESERKAARLQLDALAGLESERVPINTHPFIRPKGGKIKPAGIYALGIPAAFELAVGVPKGVMLGKFLKGPMQESIKKHYPKMRRSAARAILIDEVCGKAVTEIPIWARQRTNLILDMLDTFETMLIDKQQEEVVGGGK